MRSMIGVSPAIYHLRLDIEYRWPIFRTSSWTFSLVPELWLAIWKVASTALLLLNSTKCLDTKTENFTYMIAINQLMAKILYKFNTNLLNVIIVHQLHKYLLNSGQFLQGLLSYKAIISLLDSPLHMLSESLVRTSPVQQAALFTINQKLCDMIQVFFRVVNVLYSLENFLFKTCDCDRPATTAVPTILPFVALLLLPLLLSYCIAYQSPLSVIMENVLKSNSAADYKSSG
ncbi:hypothetical protein GQX74_010652 [Glossina fuscipes]|nr:hypothetical protein GQX74_010652 [Glossina fuscipes]